VPFVYILRCADGTLYTGIAKDLEQRLERHRRGKASKYTRVRLPVTLAWKRRVMSWSRALKEEIRIKSLTRAQKEELLSVIVVKRKRKKS
jgi:predicted GIY-YIG superfamily endonuclease